MINSLEDSKIKFSYSRINTFDNCPQKYKIQYVDLIKSSDDSIEAFMGRIVHQVLENLYLIDDLASQYITFDKIIEMYDKAWIENWHTNIYISNFKFNPKTYNKRTVYMIGIECLKNYYNSFNQSGYFKQNVYAVEFPFEINIGKYCFRGFIDRIDKDIDGSINIIDYKTSSKSKSSNQAINDMQMAIYGIAIRKMIKDYNEINSSLFYLRNKDFILFKHTNEKIDFLEKKILNKIDAIINTSHYNAKESILCEWCYYWKNCDIKVTNNPSIKLQ